MTRQDAVYRQTMVLCCQEFKAAQRALEDALSAYAVVRLRRAAIEADLEVERVKLLEAASPFRRDQCPIGADAHDEPASRAMFKHLPDTRINKWFTTAKMDLEDLHIRQFIDQRQGLFCFQLARPAAARG